DEADAAGRGNQRLESLLHLVQRDAGYLCRGQFAQVGHGSGSRTLSLTLNRGPGSFNVRPMKTIIRTGLVLAAAALVIPAGAAPAGKTMADVLAAAKPSDWRTLDPENTLYLERASGRVVIELAPEFAPQHVANVRTLVRGKYFDGLSIVRSQDNFVVQWADPADADHKKPVGDAKKKLTPGFDRRAAGLQFVALPDPDTYAPQTGFVYGLPAARDKADGTAWLVH